MPAPILRTPDGRYIIVNARLWRATDPSLSPDDHTALVASLMDGRRAVRQALRDNDRDALAAARAAVDAAKIALGERGPVWWRDGDPDLNRHLVRTTAYAPWYASLEAGA